MKSPITQDITGATIAQVVIPGAYGRVSTDRQEKEATIETQISELHERVIQDGHLLTEDNLFLDNGWSGAMMRRPGLDAMIDAARAGRFNVLYVYDLSRLSRVYHYQRMLLEELEGYGIRIVSLHNRPVETEEDGLFRGLEGLFGEYERMKILQRTRSGRERKAKEKVLMSGQARYGWERVPKTKETAAHWKILDDEANVVRMMFDWIGKQGMSVNGIQKKLFELGIPAKKKKRKWWSKGHIRRILTSEIYLTGDHYYNTSRAVPAKNPLNTGYKKLKNTSKEPRPQKEWILEMKVPIILNRPGDKQLFEKVQKILADNQKYARQKRRHEYLLSGKIFCECGKPRSGDGSSRHGHHYYRCTERIYVDPEKRECIAMGVNATAVDEKVWDEITRFFASPKLLKPQAKKWLESQSKVKQVQDIQREKLQKQIENIEKEEERYQEMYAKKLMNFNQLKKKIRECNNRTAGINKQLNELYREDKAAKQVTTAQIDDFCKQVTITLKELDFRNKTAVIRELVDKVIIYGQKKVELWGHVPVTAKRLGYGLENRDSNASIPTFEPMQFHLEFDCPKPRKERVIAQRDKLGRIVHSHAPAIDVHST